MPVATSYNLQFPINYSILLLHAWEFLFLGPHSSMQSATDSFNQEIPFSTLFYLGVLIQDICEMYVSNVQSPSPYINIKEYLKLVTGLRCIICTSWGWKWPIVDFASLQVDHPMVDVAKELNNETSSKVAGAHEKTGGARVHLNQW